MQCREVVGIPNEVLKLKGYKKCVLEKQEVTVGLRDGNNSVLKR
jgi:hypothetical protein